MARKVRSIHLYYIFYLCFLYVCEWQAMYLKREHIGHLYRALTFIPGTLLAAIMIFGFAACGQKQPYYRSAAFSEMFGANRKNNNSNMQMDTAIFSAGCFWCVEAQFKMLRGVDSVISGYIGGKTPNPTYKEVCSGSTGHAEACKVIYNPAVISYDELLAAFFIAHDPTQLNRQGNDVGTQYRSGIFYLNDEQKTKADYYIKRLNEELAYGRPVVTELTPATVFYPAEDYHQDYYKLNPEAGYCQMVIRPKMENFRKVFAEKVKQSIARDYGFENWL